MSKAEELRQRARAERQEFYRLRMNAGRDHAPRADRLRALEADAVSRIRDHAPRFFVAAEDPKTARGFGVRMIPEANCALPADELVGILAELHDLRYRCLTLEAMLEERREEDGSLGPTSVEYRKAVRALVNGAKLWRQGFTGRVDFVGLIDAVVNAERGIPT